jgi:hypothetical protein
LYLLDYLLGGRKEWINFGKDLLQNLISFGGLLEIVFFDVFFGLFEHLDELIFAPIAGPLKNILDVME